MYLKLMDQSVNLVSKIAVENVGCIFSYFCSGRALLNGATITIITTHDHLRPATIFPSPPTTIDDQV